MNVLLLMTHVLDYIVINISPAEVYFYFEHS